MKKILMRGGVSPLKNITPEELLDRDFQGTNTGNLVYQYSLYRMLKTADVEIEMDNYAINPKKAAEYSEKYDAYIIPLADAFRSDFRGKLKAYADLINAMTIPVIVVGVGIRASSMEELMADHDYDEEVKMFIDAVLKKSKIVGLRGALTGKYLEKLGYKEGVDFTPIGCPSMYMNGDTIKLREFTVNPDMKISLNASTVTENIVLKKLYEISEQYPNYAFVPQFYNEFIMTYLGFKSTKGGSYYPTTVNHKFYQEGKVKFFLTAKGWFNFIESCDLSVGSRLHGNVVAMVNGTPAITVVKDLRMKELIDLHQIPHIMQDQIDQYEDLEAMVNSLDFTTVEKAQKANFDNFKNFLDINGLDSVFNYPEEECYLDREIKKVDFLEGVTPISAASREEILSRLSSFEILEKRAIRLAKRK